MGWRPFNPDKHEPSDRPSVPLKLMFNSWEPSLPLTVWRLTTYIKSNPVTGLDRPRGFQEDEAPRISRQSAHEGVKVVSPTHRPHLPPENIPGTHFC